jgi:hypothetical protein
MDPEQLNKRIDKMFENRKTWESLWQIAYEYMAPERAFFHQAAHEKIHGNTGEHIFDSTAIDSAERLVNLIVSGLIPPWSPWFRLVPGRTIVNPEQKELLRPLLEYAENMIHSVLAESNFYQEMQPMLLDRVIGGTGALLFLPGEDGVAFRALPLAEIALEEDNSGEVSAVARKYYLSLRDIMRSWDVPEDFRLANERNPEEPRHEVQAIAARDATGMWQYLVRLKQPLHVLETRITPYPPILATRWTRLPGTPYGRGPGLRALADVRALNKIKELSLQNAAKAVTGIYTAVDDGVLNPYVLSLDPGAIIPVASNSPNERSIDVLPRSADFDVAMWSIDELRNSIRAMFMSDQFGPLERTPRSATEVAERTRIVAQELGATIARLQYELLVPVLRSVFKWLADRDMLPPELNIDGTNINVEFISQLAQAQWAQQEQNIVQFMSIMTEFGQVDPKAGLLVDIHAAGRKVAEIKGIPTEILRSSEQIEMLMQEAAQNMEAMNDESGGAAPGA